MMSAWTMDRTKRKNWILSKIVRKSIIDFIRRFTRERYSRPDIMEINCMPICKLPVCRGKMRLKRQLFIDYILESPVKAFNPFDLIMLMRYRRKKRNLNMFLCCPIFNFIGKKFIIRSNDFKQLPVFLKSKCS